MYIYIYTYIHTNIYVYIYLNICIYIWAVAATGTRLVLSGVVCLFVCGRTNLDHLKEIPRGCLGDEDVSKDVI